MTQVPAHIGLDSYHSVQFYVHDLDASVKWHQTRMDLSPVAKSSPAQEKKHGMKSVIMKCNNNLSFVFSMPIEQASSAGKWLKHHPDGCAFLNFRVKNLENTALFLADRKAPFLYDVQTHNKADGGYWKETAIATSVGDAGMRFIEETKFGHIPPGFEVIQDWDKTPSSKFGFDAIDHVTCNGRSMHGITEFYRAVLGFDQYWGIEFHTTHHNPNAGTGSGLESIVMWDPHSGIKFATNQPYAPFYNNSQIQIYVEDNIGSGIQHLALSVPAIIPAVAGLREAGCKFLDAPGKYYDQLPERIKANKIGTIKEPMEDLRKLGILVDGRDNKYLLQLFMKELFHQSGKKEDGPFFYEVIQRAGDPGFGDGNFKALFDSIEQEQVAHSRQEMRDRMDSLC
jgi:4-hydroxyphenylpyruvate dioxygenase